MGKKSETERAVNLLERLIPLVQSLKPPVMAFERSIRSSPLRILISVLLSSRTKDRVTEAASTRLFARGDTAAEILALGEETIASLIYPVGFYRQKAGNIIRICRYLIEGGSVPDRFDELCSLPGVGRKTANLVLALAYGKPAIAVDIHVFRISKRLGWSNGVDPAAVEADLRELFPESVWTRLNQTLVGFGQSLCRPLRPLCTRCPFTNECCYFKQTAVTPESID